MLISDSAGVETLKSMLPSTIRSAVGAVNDIPVEDFRTSPPFFVTPAGGMIPQVVLIVLTDVEP